MGLVLARQLQAPSLDMGLWSSRVPFSRQPPRGLDNRLSGTGGLPPLPSSLVVISKATGGVFQK